MTSATATSNFRIQRDLKEIQEASWADSPPLLSSTVDDRLSHIATLVVGPPETPYAGGFFVFDFKFPPTYPNEPPAVRLLSTSEGRVRLNPNLYADGKVCLSILGTWRGETAEIWRSSYSVLYVLQALQSIIMNSEPYHNEPGFEKEKSDRGILLTYHKPQPKQAEPAGGQSPEQQQQQKDVSSPVSPSTEQQQAFESHKVRVVVSKEQITLDRAHYSFKISHEVIRIAVCDVLEALLNITPDPPPPLPVREPTETMATSAMSASSIAAEYSTGPIRTALLASTHIGLFAAQIKRLFLLYFPAYVKSCTSAEAAIVEGLPFRLMTFEVGRNACTGVFQWRWLLQRLHAIHHALDVETDAWRAKGRELTVRSSYLASILRDEATRMAEQVSGVSGGPIDDNVFTWVVTLLMSEGLYEEAMYQVEIVFSEDLNQPPRVRFLQPIWHPNISEDGIPFTLHTENTIPLERRYTPSAIVPSLRALLTEGGALASPCTWMNPVAASQLFGKPEDQKAFKSRARQLSRKTTE